MTVIMVVQDMILFFQLLRLLEEDMERAPAYPEMVVRADQEVVEDMPVMEEQEIHPQHRHRREIMVGVVLLLAHEVEAAAAVLGQLVLQGHLPLGAMEEEARHQV